MILKYEIFVSRHIFTKKSIFEKMIEKIKLCKQFLGTKIYEVEYYFYQKKN